jgi:hypothetical protein
LIGDVKLLSRGLLLFSAGVMVLVTIALPSYGGTNASERAESYGYIWDVESEKVAEPAVPMTLVVPPADDRVDWQGKIFNPQLTKEFERRYREAFGYSEAEQSTAIYMNSVVSFQTQEGFSTSATEINKAQTSFGNFMINRLIEYHADNFFKSSKSLAPVYQLKERLSKVEVEVRPGYSITANYSLSANVVDVNFKNPYVGSKAVYDLGHDELTISIGRLLTPTVVIENVTLIRDAINKVILRKQLTAMLSTDLLYSTYFDLGRTVRQNLELIGLRYTF